MDARTIIRVDGIVRILYPWDFPSNVQPPYMEYAVTVLDWRNALEFHEIALTHKINWYGFDKPPTPDGLTQWL